MYISSIDLFEALKPSMGDANAKTLVSKLEQTEAAVEARVEAKVETKFEKAFETQAKVYKDDIKSLKEFMTDNFSTKEDMAKNIARLEVLIANSRADSNRQNFLFWATQLTILAGLMIAILFKLK